MNALSRKELKCSQEVSGNSAQEWHAALFVLSEVEIIPSEQIGSDEHHIESPTAPRTRFSNRLVSASLASHKCAI